MASLPQSLAEWRGREGVGREQLARSLRVEASTLERIESGEVAPGSALRERIGRMLDGPRPTANPAEESFDRAPKAEFFEPCYSCSADEFPIAPAPLPGPARDGCVDAAASLGQGETAASALFRSVGAWIAQRDGEPARIEILLDSVIIHSLAIEEARALATKVRELVRVQDATPAGFARCFP